MPIFINYSKDKSCKMRHQILQRCFAKIWRQNRGGLCYFVIPSSFCNIVCVSLFYVRDRRCPATDSSPLFTSSEASLLLKKLEEVFVRTSQGSGEDYLSILTRAIKGGREKDALDRLNVVRLALARYFARCTALDLVGK
jgi:hypothetical protein